MKKKKTEIFEKLELLMIGEYTVNQFNTWINFKCDDIISELENNNYNFDDTVNQIFNYQKIKQIKI